MIRTIYDGPMLNCIQAIGYNDEGRLAGWIMGKHPDGQWVSLARMPASQDSPNPSAPQTSGGVRELLNLVRDAPRMDDPIAALSRGLLDACKIIDRLTHPRTERTGEGIMSELLPCPFQDKWCRVERSRKTQAKVQSVRCAAHTHWMSLELWNTRAPASSVSEPVAGSLDEQMQKFFEFLDGSQPWDGVWFGELHPARKGRYWWRSVMRELLQASRSHAATSGEVGELTNEEYPIKNSGIWTTRREGESVQDFVNRSVDEWEARMVADHKPVAWMVGSKPGTPMTHSWTNTVYDKESADEHAAKGDYVQPMYLLPLADRLTPAPSAPEGEPMRYQEYACGCKATEGSPDHCPEHGYTRMCTVLPKKKPKRNKAPSAQEKE